MYVEEMEGGNIISKFHLTIESKSISMNHNRFKNPLK